MLTCVLIRTRHHDGIQCCRVGVHDKVTKVTRNSLEYSIQMVQILILEVGPGGHQPLSAKALLQEL